MLETYHNFPRLRSGLVPGDLTEWVDRHALAHLILESQVCQGRGGVKYTAADRNLPPAMLLSLLIYCYATGTLATSDIERAIHQDAMIHYLCARTYPEGKDIRRFRRQNRDRILSCLAAVMRRVWVHHFQHRDQAGLGFAPRGSIESPAPNGWDETLDPALLAGFAKEAEERVRRAAWLDTMALDD